MAWPVTTTNGKILDCVGGEVVFVTGISSTGRFTGHRMTDTVTTDSLGC
jgi:hypothetical protein